MRVQTGDLLLVGASRDDLGPGPSGEIAGSAKEFPVKETAAAAADQVVVEVVDRFNAAWNAHDLAGALAMCTPDCAFESTSPAPEGTRSVGRDAIAAAWQPIFDDRASRITVEQAFVAGARLVQRWRYDWDGGHVRGIDVITVRDGLISEKLSYVKG
jgi:hypothetical protein